MKTVIASWGEGSVEFFVGGGEPQTTVNVKVQHPKHTHTHTQFAGEERACVTQWQRCPLLASL